MLRESERFTWLPTALAAVALVGFLTAFGWELVTYQQKVVEWARRDLQSRADLAAANLEEPLRTQDFRRLHAFADKIAADGYRLSVLDANGHGRVFDTFSNPDLDIPQYIANQRCGEYLVRLGIPVDHVMRPFRSALVGIVLAGLVGITGVLLFFFVTYRQRVHIRELKRLERFRREFVSDFSHELKTPLTGILGAVDLLEGDSPLVPLIRKEAQRLNRLVQAILDLARLEREGLAMNSAEFELADLVRDVASRYPCDCHADGQCVVVGDAQLVAQALDNLIANAVRHSGSTEIAVSLAVCGGMAEVAVEDHGVGIPLEARERVFERFYRVDPARAAETGGAGLGLAIVRQIARMHHGDVTLAEAHPHGCRFTLSLPLTNH